MSWTCVARAQLVPVGGEFQVNTYTTSSQFFPSAASLGASGFVVLWSSAGSVGSDTDSLSIQARRYDAAGAPLSAEFQVNSYTTSAQRFTAVASDAAGNFVVAWESFETPSDYFLGVEGRRYDSTGAPISGEFQVNTYTTSFQGFLGLAIASDDAGDFVVVWGSNGSAAGTDTDFSSVQARRYDSTGTPQGAEFQVNTYTTGSQGGPIQEQAVASDADGNFVVVWTSGGSTGSDTDYTSIQGRRYNSSGVAVTSEFQVNTYTTGTQGSPRVARDAAGNFVVVWNSTGSSGSDDDGSSIQGRRYASTGAALGVEFQVNTYTTGDVFAPVVASDPSGNFVVAWSSEGSPGSDLANSVQARLYDSTGAAVGAQFQVNTYTTGDQYVTGLATDAAGNFVVAWHSNGSSGTDQDGISVQAQRFASPKSILGKKLLVKDPTGNEPQRTVIVLAKETATDIGPTLFGNPVASGATLRVITKGTTDSDQTYVLDAAGWSTAGSAGFKYAGPTAADGDPVLKVVLKRTSGGTALVKAVLKGNVGTQSLDVVPPDLGDEGGLILTIPGGGTYCASFGGAASGAEVRDDGQLWKVLNATAQGCPTP